MGSTPRIFVSQGQRFGRGTVIDPEIRTGTRGRRGALLICDCGTVYEAEIINLTSDGHTRSCGCLARDHRAAGPNHTHGLARHPLYRIWKAMLARCEDPDSKEYPRYGGQGITVCDEWRDVVTFITWIEENLGPRPDGMVLCLTSRDKQYRPGSVRWGTHSQRGGTLRKQRGTSSRYKGVTLYRRDGVWMAQITVNRQLRYLGRFPTEEAAASAYDDAAIAAWGRFARLNFPAQDPPGASVGDKPARTEIG